MALSAESTGRVGAATHSVDLDTLDSVRYKMRSFLVGSKSCPTVKDSSIRLDVPKAPSTGCVNLVGAATHIPAYRLFETKRYDGPLGPLGPLGRSVVTLGWSWSVSGCLCRSQSVSVGRSRSVGLGRSVSFGRSRSLGLGRSVSDGRARSSRSVLVGRSWSVRLDRSVLVHRSLSVFVGLSWAVGPDRSVLVGRS